MSASDNALSSLSIPWYQKVEGFVWNAATGTLTQDQKQGLAVEQAKSVVAASGGTVAYDAALKQAEGDVTNVLTMDHADPSQASVFNNPGLDNLFAKVGWIVTIIVAIAIIWIGIQIWSLTRR